MTPMHRPTKTQPILIGSESQDRTGPESDPLGAPDGLPLTFPHGLPGFPAHRRFHLRRAGGPFFWLQGTEDGAPTFLMVDPKVAAPETELALPPGLPALMQARAVNELEILTIVTLPRGPEDVATMNLQGLVVVNPSLGIARQVVMVDSNLGIRTPIGKARSEVAA
ncbi:MAG: flagellar assembly protein FliW [Gemmatimonadales bacterium]|nr:MAG: flagellar assembly protein FliW [Gemmatimonadales bacterium]